MLDRPVAVRGNHNPAIAATTERLAAAPIATAKASLKALGRVKGARMRKHGDKDGNAEHPAEIAQHVEGAGRLADLAACDRIQDRILSRGHRHRHTRACKD